MVWQLFKSCDWPRIIFGPNGTGLVLDNPSPERLSSDPEFDVRVRFVLADHDSDSLLPRQSVGVVDLDGNESGRFETFDLHRINRSGHWDDQSVRVDRLLGCVVTDFTSELWKWNSLSGLKLNLLIKLHYVKFSTSIFKLYLQLYKKMFLMPKLTEIGFGIFLYVVIWTQMEIWTVIFFNK